MRLTRLPRNGHWEVEVLAPPSRDPAEPWLAMVVDASARQVRFAAPISGLEDLPGVVVQAATAPVGCAAGRPKALRCREPLREVLQDVAKELGASLRVTEHLPVFDEATARLRAHLDPSWLPAEPEPWRAVLEELMRERPWRQLPDSVQFRFLTDIAGLKGAVAVLLGQAGEQRGLALYPSQGAYEAFHEGAVRGMYEVPWSCTCAHLDRADDLQARHVEQAEASGLARQGFVLQLFHLEGGEARALTASEERACRAAVQAVLGVWRQHGEALARVPTLTPVHTDAGDLRVSTVPAAVDAVEEPLILEVDHAVIVAELMQKGVRKKALVMKAGKRDAERLARLLRDGRS